MKYIVVITAIFLTYCNTKPKTKKIVGTVENIISNTEKYPDTIIHLGLQKWYDETKWVLYCIYCDDTCKFEKQAGIKDTITFASLKLNFENIEQFNDTTEINFYFYFRDTIKCDFRTIRNLEIASGAGFKKGSDSIYYYTSPTTMHRFWTKDIQSRYNNPLQLDVIDYIRKNKDKLHPWFYNEALKRGVIEK